MRGLLAVACAAVIAALWVPPLRSHLTELKRMALIHGRTTSVGQALPPMAFESLDGISTAVRPRAGSGLIINVFATWCPPCRAELPDLKQAVPVLSRRGFAVVGIDQGEPAQRVAAFVAVNRIPYSVLVDVNGYSRAMLDAREIPTTIVVDAGGVVKSIYHGPLATSQFIALAANDTDRAP